MYLYEYNHTLVYTSIYVVKLMHLSYFIKCLFICVYVCMCVLKSTCYGLSVVNVDLNCHYKNIYIMIDYF